MSTLPSLSVEAKIRRQLAVLNCPEAAFAQFNGTIGKTKFGEGMSGRPGLQFSPQEGERLLGVIQEMYELQRAAGVPVDWRRVEQIETALLVRKTAEAFREMFADHSLDECEAKLTREVGSKR